MPPHTRSFKHVMRNATLAILSLALLGCTASTQPVPASGASLLTASTDPPDDKPPIELHTPVDAQTTTTAVNAAVGSLGSVRFDGNLIPLVSPGGQYIAVQEGQTAQYWDFLLARPTDALVPRFTIAIYRIDVVDGGPRQKLVRVHTLENIGLIGRHADKDGFLVESPLGDGSRRIGIVNWQTGKVAWILNRDVNAFATRSKDGRLAWCARAAKAPIAEFGKAVEDAAFDLFVQKNDGVLLVPAGTGSWLMPMWSDDGVTLFAFHLKQSGEMEMAVFNTSSAQTIKNPRQLVHLSYQGSAMWAFQATAATRSPAAPDGSPRLIFNMPGQSRLYEYDARRDSQSRLRPLPHRSVAAAWRNENEIVYSTPGALYWLSTQPDIEPVELIRGLNIPFVTSNKRHPFILVSRDANNTRRLNLWAMEFIDPETVRQAIENLPNKKR